MPSVYTVVYDATGKFIICNKNTVAYYFTSNGSSKAFYIPPKAVLNGPGLMCFPGGGIKKNSPLVSGLDEFREETSVRLTSFPQDRKANIECFKYTDPLGVNFWGVYYRVSPANLLLIKNQVDLALANSSQIAALISAHTLTVPVDLPTEAASRALIPYAEDNELSYAEVWDCTDPATQALINSWNNTSQNWFRQMFNDLLTSYNA